MRNVRGLSVIELMVVLSIVSISAAMVTPSLSNMIAQRQMNTFHQTLITALRFTKLQAINLNKIISLCPSANKTSCDVTNQWQNGFIAFIDENGNGWGPGDSVIRQWRGQETLIVKNPAAAPNFVGYTPRGVSLFTVDGFSTIMLCHPQGKATQKGISMSYTIGRITPISSDQKGCI